MSLVYDIQDKLEGIYISGRVITIFERAAVRQFGESYASIQ